MPDPSIDVAEPSFERRIVSVLFADLVGFTSLSERLDPEDVATIQDAYFSTVRETVARHGGQLEKFIGDAAMAVFGVPRARDDDAERAIRAGLALIGAVELLGSRLGLEADAGLQLRVGVNTGEVVSAESGPDRGRVTGDAVNLAARLQASAEPGTVLVGQLTTLSAADAVEFEPRAELQVKGKAEPVAASRVIGMRPERSREEALGALRAPLLGREAELGQLEARLAAVREDHHAAEQLIVAPPGVGKSRLLGEFGTRAAASGATVVRARVRADVLGPVEPVGQLLRGALEAATATSHEDATAALNRALVEGQVPSHRAEVVAAEVAATLWRVAGAADEGAAGSAGTTIAPGAAAVAAERDARFGAWLDALDVLAGARPNVWLVEDVHWAGGDLHSFLSMAATWPSRGGRLVVATARPSVLEVLPASASLLELAPLEAVDSAQLVTALVGDALPDALVRSVAERSDGNPLFIEELLRSWISSGTLVAVAGGWQLAVPTEAVPLPATVQAIYAAQLDDLPGPARLVARRASVAGRRFAVKALEPLEVREPDEGLGDLRRRAFLRGPEADPLNGEVYAYRHALLRDAGYASLSRAERSRYHLALATWLEQSAGADAGRVAEPIASHYEAALASMPEVGGDADARTAVRDAARLWLERAADAALGLAAHETAIGLLGRALGLAVGQPLEMARLRLRRGELLAVTGDMATGTAELEDALDVFRKAFRAASDDETRRAARLGYANATAALGDAMIEQIRFIEARDLVSSALADIGHKEDVLVGRLLALRAWANVAQGDREGTLAEAEHAWELVRGSASPEVELEVRGHLASVRQENNIENVAEWRQLEELARAHSQWVLAVRALTMRAAMLAGQIPGRELLGYHDEALALAEAHGYLDRVAWARYARTDWLLHLGEWDEAVVNGLEGITLGERNAYHRPVFRTFIALMPIFTARRDMAAMTRFGDWFTAHRSIFPEPPSAYGQVLQTAIDICLADLGQPGVTGRVLGPGILVKDVYTNTDWLAAVEIVVRDWIARGDLGRAREELAGVRSAWLAPEQGPPKPHMLASLNLMEAWLARAEGRAQDATAHAREALDGATRAEAPWWRVRAFRALPDGAATASELAEAEEIERRLRVPREATGPP